MVRINNRPIPIAFIQKAIKSICRLEANYRDNNKVYGTGFFLRILSQKFLITCCHNIENSIKEKSEIQVELYNKELIKIRLNERYIKYLERPLNIVAIEMKDSDFIYKDIEFLDYDKNFKNDYSIYKDLDVFTMHYEFNQLVCSSGRVVNINDYEFGHSISTEKGASGCPIILFSESVYVIGIHSTGDTQKNLNYATFIGEIIKEIEKEKNSNIQGLNKNKLFEYNNTNNIKKLDIII